MVNACTKREKADLATEVDDVFTTRGRFKAEWRYLAEVLVQCYPELLMSKAKLQAYINSTPKSKRNALQILVTSKDNIRRCGLPKLQILKNLNSGLFESPVYSSQARELNPLAQA
jgi:hypothetical protein